MASRRLVIDASVARATGAEKPISKPNRDFLLEVLSICHEVVTTPELTREWKKHRSSFAYKWRASMVAGRKLSTLPETRNAIFRDRIGRSGLTLRQRAAMEKDASLIEAALAADRIVISQDKEARKLFSVLAADWPVLRDVVWLRPDESPTEALEWLRRGAKAVRKWQLGAARTAK